MGTLYFVLLLFLSFIFISLAEKYKSKKFLIVGILIISIVSGFRGVECGIDTSYYYNAFINNFPVKWMFEEVGFRFITNTLMNLVHSATIVMFIYALVTNFLIIFRMWDFKDKCSFKFMIFLYLFIYFINSMNIMRQFLSISIIFYSTKLLEKKRYLLFILIVFIATSIHQSSILGLLLIIVYLWNNTSNNNKIYMAIPLFILLIIAGNYAITYEKSTIEHYISTTNMTNNINLTYIYRIIISIFTLFLFKSNRKIVPTSKVANTINISDNQKQINTTKDKDMKIFTILYFCGLALSSMGMFFKFMQRMGYIYMIFELLYWGYLAKNSKNPKINIFLISIYAIYVLMLEFISNGSGIFPYYFNF